VGYRFETTRWSIVLQAGHQSGPASKEALARLCEVYWYPVYAFVRRSGFGADEAQDLTQEFFTRVVEKDYLSAVTPSRGRFRSFLLAAVRHFLSNERDRLRAKKRGGGQSPLPLEFQTAEGRYQLDPADPTTPEMVFERKWATTVLESAFARLEAEQNEAGKKDGFALLKGALTGDHDVSYADIASRLATTEGAVKVAVHRLRRRFGELLREEIGQTVETAAEVDDELRYLFAALER